MDNKMPVHKSILAILFLPLAMLGFLAIYLYLLVNVGHTKATDEIDRMLES